MRSRHVVAGVDLDTIRASAERIRRQTGVGLIAVVKADGYGVGAAQVADALAPVVDEFAYFSIHEARQIGRPGVVLGPPEGEPAWYTELGVRPAISTPEAADRFGRIDSALSVDTGMQRFGCGEGEVEKLLRRCRVVDAFTHTADADGALRLREVCGGRAGKLHAAATSLLDNPDARLDAVRPGYGLYRGALRVTTRVVGVRECKGPIGYTRFESPRIGVILAGYSNHVAPGPVLINGRRQRILEVGMNSSFVSVDARDREGDEVVLLGDELNEAVLAEHFKVRPHEILCRYGSMGMREYCGLSSPGSAGTIRSFAASLPQT